MQLEMEPTSVATESPVVTLWLQQYDVAVVTHHHSNIILSSDTVQPRGTLYYIMYCSNW